MVGLRNVRLRISGFLRLRPSSSPVVPVVPVVPREGLDSVRSSNVVVPNLNRPLPSQVTF